MEEIRESLLTDSIRKTLKIDSIDDVIDMEYPDRGMDFNREEIEKGMHHRCGSVRISSGRYYTHKEFEEWRKRVLALPL